LRGDPAGVGDRPVDRGWPEGIVCDQHDLVEIELGEDLVEISHRSGCAVYAYRRACPGRPSRGVEGDDATGAAQVWHEPVVQVQVVGEPMQ